ncbi:uncharacterized protein LOC121514168 [Cheilinus undulatus]|uniref:uncharacterized protein LOC121514168 n=1 Tax=Cheilinus undulatus TaxID=241271 RepID=UPI001BD4BB3A|nr:uncharacterized protein LOC121514168 [Cheilinus undulatus]
MKMWSMKIIILLLFCYTCLSTENPTACQSPDNQTVYFESRNFHNILCWVPFKPEVPGQKVVYSVQYWSYGEKFSKKQAKECQNITALSCDLSAETPSHHDNQYLAKVYANGHIHGCTTTRFTPLKQTIFGPPSLSIHTTVSSLHVNVTLPMGPNGESIADIITKSRGENYQTVIAYEIQITKPEWAAKVNHSKTGRFIINFKNTQTEYCGYVIYMPSVEWGRSKSEKAPFCAKLQNDSLKILPWLLVSAALLMAIIIISVAFISYYVKGGKGKKTPKTLVISSHTDPRVLKPLDGNLHISKPEFNTQSERTVYATIQVKPKVPSVGTGGYSPQDIPCPTWLDSAESSEGTGARSPTPDPVDTSAQSSEIYSVVAVHVPAEENEDNQHGIIKNTLSPSGEKWDKCKMSPELTTHVVAPLPDEDSCEGSAAMPLLLHTVRDSNGQLMLPSLDFKLQSSTGGRERRPLLSDLIDSNKEGPSLASLQSFDSSEWSDSGCDDSTLNTPIHPYCNTNYSPSQPVVPYLQHGCQSMPFGNATSESGYKQNWMPEIPLGIPSKDSCEYRRTENLWTWKDSHTEEDAEGDDGQGQKERSREIPLESWGIQIPE